MNPGGNMNPSGKKVSSAGAAVLIGSALVLGASGPAIAHSTLPGITVSRSFSPSPVAPGQKVTVTLSVKVGAIGASPLRGFYLTESLPAVLAPGSGAVTLNGSVISSVSESAGSGTLYSNCKTVRWLLEKPPGFTENKPLAASTTLTVTYEVTIPAGTPPGNLVFPGLSWVGVIPTLGDSGDHFGFEDTASTLPVTSLPKLALSPPSVAFSAEEGASNPASQAVLVSNAGGGTLPPLSPAITYLSRAGWLSLTTTGSGNSQSLQNSVSLAGLAPDTYGATVAVSAAGASNTPQSYAVSLVVRAKASLTQPTLELSPPSVHFTVEEGTSAPPQTVTVGNRGIGTLAQISPSLQYRAGSGWLAVSASGSGNGQRLENQVLVSTLAPGTYQATVSVSSPGASNTPQRYVVFLDVAPRRMTVDAGPGVDGSGRDGGVAATSPREAGTLPAGAAGYLLGGCATAGSGAQRLPWRQPLWLLLTVGATIGLRRSLCRRRRCR